MLLHDNYTDLISHIDVSRNSDAVEHIKCNDLLQDSRIKEFTQDMVTDNDIIETNLIKNKAYKEAAIIPFTAPLRDRVVKDAVITEQKTFSGSKLFYLNNDLDKILITAVPKSLEGKVHMVITRLNKINEKISRLNHKIKKDNIELFAKRHKQNDAKERIINEINKQLRV